MIGGRVCFASLLHRSEGFIGWRVLTFWVSKQSAFQYSLGFEAGGTRRGSSLLLAFLMVLGVQRMVWTRARGPTGPQSRVTLMGRVATSVVSRTLVCCPPLSHLEPSIALEKTAISFSTGTRWRRLPVHGRVIDSWRRLGATSALSYPALNTIGQASRSRRVRNLVTKTFLPPTVQTTSSKLVTANCSSAHGAWRSTSCPRSATRLGGRQTPSRYARICIWGHGGSCLASRGGIPNSCLQRVIATDEVQATETGRRPSCTTSCSALSLPPSPVKRGYRTTLWQCTWHRLRKHRVVVHRVPYPCPFRWPRRLGRQDLCI